jgi:hypothetical protein
MKAPIFILGAHKSGTSLLRSLFDGHPDLFVVPIEDHVFRHLGYPISYPYQYQNSKEYSEEEIKDNFLKWINCCNSSNDKFADSIAKDIFNVDEFVKLINSKNELVTKELITIYFRAIQASLELDVNAERRIVTKSVENAEFAIDLAIMFPDAKFIHIFRNPYASFVALRKYKTKNGNYPLLHKPLQALRHDYYFLERNKRLIENYLVLDYDNLVLDSVKTIEELSVFLEIEFNESLLTPTFLNKTWHGNSTSEIKFNTIDKIPLQKWKNEIFPYEVFLINNTLSSFMKSMKISQVEITKGIYKRAKGEKISTYFLNRSYKYFIPSKS